VQGAKVLVTGPAGTIGLPLVEHLARDNEVWGIARFADPGTREKVEAVGVATRAVDLASGDFGEVPDDFDYVIHLAFFKDGGWDFDHALRVDAEGTGLLLSHCRRARAALVMSTGAVYRPAADASHAYTEPDPLGEGNTPGMATYSMSKIAEEAVARTCARLYDLPVVITRMNAAYGPNGGWVASCLDAIVAGAPVVHGWHGSRYSPIHQDDINVQTERLLDAASVPATVVNWGGDEVVGPEEWCTYFGELVGRKAEVVVHEMPDTHPACIFDVTKRQAITGPCTVSWRDGMRRLVEARYPEGIDAPAGMSA
jgi:nucleoside-diphosphate-sugar epimerase